MRALFRLFLALAAVPLMFVACQPDDPTNDTQKEYTFVLTSSQLMEFGVEGGEGLIEWTLEEVTRNSPVPQPVPTLYCEAEWIELYAEDLGAFAVAKNEGEAREAVIKISYSEQSVEVTVKQAGVSEEPQPDAWFKIDVQEVHAASAITQVTPADDKMHYVMFLDEVSYMQFNQIYTAEQLWEDDLAAFESAALNNGMNLKEYMEAANVLFQGKQRVQWNSVRPGVKSVLYVYGVKFADDGASYEPQTEISWEVICPDRAPLQDVEFDLSVDVKGAEVTLDVDANSWDGYYVVKVVDANNELYVGEGVSFDDDYMAEIADEWVDVYSSNLSAGHSMQDILDNICYKGDMSLELQLDSYVLYSALVYPVAEYDGFVQVVGEPSYINFSTEEVGQSDMAFDIEVTNCYVRVADIRITPSNPDETWLLMITPTSYLPDDYDNETLLDYALGEFIYYTYEFKGEITTHMNTLYPNTEYVIVVFGYSGGVVTTEVCSEVFKTEKEGECELEVTDVIVGGPYRPSDLYNYDPVTFKYYTQPYYYDSSQYIVTMEVKTSQPTSDIFSYFISKMDYDWGGYDTTFYDLLIDTCDPFEISEGIYDYGGHYACAAAFDYKGNVTPMWMSELYEWTMEDIRPIEEFIEKWEANNSQMQVLSVGRDGVMRPVVMK